MGCKVKGYADGGKVIEREYSVTPTFGSALKNRVGMDDDGYGNPKKAPKKRLSISTATEELPNVIAARNKALADT